VDVGKGERFVDRLKTVARRAGHDKLWKAAGGYAAVYPINDRDGIAITTDGVGTKLLIASYLKRYDTLGIDLVAMCANDLVCVGATPTVFLDYFATGTLDDEIADGLIAGIVEGCDQAGMILAGGETAEMPGLYERGHFDLAGFAVGNVAKERLITGDAIRPGQTIIGMASSGIHSNGLSLARKVLSDDTGTLEALLTPTIIYSSAVSNALAAHGFRIAGIAHITGGGWRNLFRLNSSVGFAIEDPLPVPDILKEIAGHVQEEEMYKTFNMGMGMSVIVEGDSEPVLKALSSSGLLARQVGTVTDKPMTLTIAGSAVTLRG
jgi:phosphoribosylformylglycinamidine cyclo-ligase